MERIKQLTAKLRKTAFAIDETSSVELKNLLLSAAHTIDMLLVAEEQLRYELKIQRNELDIDTDPVI